MKLVGTAHPEILSRARSISSRLFPVFHGLRRTGTHFHKSLSPHGINWIQHLNWGADSILGSIRFLTSGQIVGAAQISRSQLERWSINLEHNGNFQRQEGETTANYFDRIWTSKRPPNPLIRNNQERSKNQGNHVWLPSGNRYVSIGQVYNDLSEILHARGRGVDLIFHDTANLLQVNREFELDLLFAGNRILDALEACVERLYVCIITLYEESGNLDGVRYQEMQKWQDTQSGSYPYPSHWLWPLTPNLIYESNIKNELKTGHEYAESVFRGQRPLERHFTNAEISDIQFSDFRYRALREAEHSFSIEESILGEELDFAPLNNKLIRIIVVSEALGLASIWSSNKYKRNSCALICSGLRSSLWLWLEDDDRAMGVLRPVVEAICRLEAHRKKPEKAMRLEERGVRTSPRDWLAASGLRKLTVLNYALGDLAHTRISSQWDGSRDLLIALQPPDEDPEIAPFRGRGYTLDAVVSMAAKTTLEIIKESSPHVSEVLSRLFAKVGVYDQLQENELQNWINRAWNSRNHDFGDPTFKRPPPNERSFTENK